MATRRTGNKPDNTASAHAGLIDAVVFLRPLAGAAAPSPELTDATATAVLSQAVTATGLQPEATTVFSHLHAFSVRAPQTFLDALEASEEVAQVQSNDLGSTPLI